MSQLDISKINREIKARNWIVSLSMGDEQEKHQESLIKSLLKWINIDFVERMSLDYIKLRQNGALGKPTIIIRFPMNLED